jgi:hypothetical protein
MSVRPVSFFAEALKRNDHRIPEEITTVKLMWETVADRR